MEKTILTIPARVSNAVTPINNSPVVFTYIVGFVLAAVAFKSTCQTMFNIHIGDANRVIVVSRDD